MMPLLRCLHLYGVSGPSTNCLEWQPLIHPGLEPLGWFPLPDKSDFRNVVCQASQLPEIPFLGTLSRESILNRFRVRF